MRRIRIIFYWLFHTKNNIGFIELLKFLAKPKVDTIAKTFIQSIESIDEYYKVTFHNLSRDLYWPKKFSISGIYQVTSETFDTKDWHYYQHEKTTIDKGDILLDIGTAEGLFPLAVVDKCTHVYMIEPSQYFFKSLLKTFEQDIEKTTIFNVAVGAKKDKVFFNEDSLDGQISSNSTSNRSIDVETIDTLIGQNKITYLKADIEGFEYEMLQGAKETITKNRPKIAITTYHKQNNPTEIISLIKSFVPEYNYIVKGIHGEEPKPVMIHFWI
ncbi:FkbM family methyltransferase [Flavobacterium soli]|uniref:FkbM family methyltransferase n=1 Tax=Flavobacterium soli TaxID=344881 RepID=UPI000428B1A8|nr:FkbM family methyltransferase [Flavobacterium soli]